MHEDDELLELEEFDVPMQPYNNVFNLDDIDMINSDDDLLDLL